MTTASGLFTIMKKLKVKKVIIGKQFQNTENFQKFFKIAKDKNIEIIVVEANIQIHIEKDLYFDILWPDSSHVLSENSINNNALVCKLFYQNFSCLFTGDIEEEAENVLISKYQGTNALKSTVLKIAHHGSKSSSTEGFLELVQPKIALIGVGENNKFGHPNDGVIERLTNLRSKNL